MPKKNLLVICNNFPNQNDTFVGNIFVKEQIKYLKDYFYNVYVVSPVAYGMEYLRGTKYHSYQFDNVHVYFPRYINNPLFWYYQKSTWVSIEAKAIMTLIEREHLHFDLIHAHFTWPSGAVGIELKQKYSVPIVITEHSSNTFIKAIETQDKSFIDTWHEADKIIHVKQSDVTAFNSVHIPRRNLIWIPNGYDSRKFSSMEAKTCREVLDLPLDKKLILNIGNTYSEVKGHKYLIEAISKIVMERKDILCIIIGSGKLQARLENQIVSQGMEDYIILAGGKPHGEIPLWINACDLFVLPSLSESFGIAQIEAMACGKPVVATRNGGSEEIITNKKLGLLVEPKNPYNLAQAILRALETTWDNDYIKMYAKQFTWNNIVKDIVNIYPPY